MSSLSNRVTCLFFAATLLPALAADWTPDPSVGNVDQHHRLYQIGRAYGDLNFDPDANLVGTHSKNPPSKKSHSTRESTYYAYGLLMTGDSADNARAQAILKRIVTFQDTNPQSPTYGVFNWNSEDPPQDQNSAAFVGLTLADVLDLDKKHPCLDPDLRGKVEQAVRLAVGQIMHRNVDAGYTNIAMLSTALAAAGEKLLAVPGAKEWAQSKLDAVTSLIGDGELTEYLSPTYNGVSLLGAYMAKKFSFSDAFGAKADALTDHFWKQIAASYHAPTYQLGGPYQRAYGDNMLEYCAVLKYFLYLGLDGAYPLPDTQLEHDWDMGCLPSIADLPISARPEFKTPTVPWRTWDVNGEVPAYPVRHLSQYRDGNLILGTVANQDEWKQKRNLVADWRNDGPPPDNLSVGFCIDESNESIPGFPGEKLHFYSNQVKDTALVAIVAGNAVPGQGMSTLVFNSGVQTTPLDGGGMSVKDGTITTYVYPVSTGTPSFTMVPDDAHHVTRLTRQWSSSDVVGSFHVLSYLVVFRPSDQPAPTVSDLALTPDSTGVAAAAKVDGTPLSLPAMK